MDNARGGFPNAVHDGETLVVLRDALHDDKRNAFLVQLYKNIELKVNYIITQGNRERGPRRARKSPCATLLGSLPMSRRTKLGEEVSEVGYEN